MKGHTALATSLLLLLQHTPLISNSVGENSKNLSPSSSAYDISSYRKYCDLASTEDVIFHDFRASSCYKKVVNPGTYREGKVYLGLIKVRFPKLLSSVPDFRRCDAVGNPDTTYNYQDVGLFSPITLRYVKVAGDLDYRFGSLDGMNVVEIGGGYAGQCAILSHLHKWESYTIIDLKEPLALMQKYLSCLEVKGVNLIDTEKLQDPIKSCDLVISNYAFSACKREVQDYYLEKVIRHSKAGYITYEYIKEYDKYHPYSASKLQDKLESYGFDVSVLPEEPMSGKNNCIFVWTKLDAAETSK